MKKLLLLVLSIVMSTTMLTACNFGGNTTDSSVNSTPSNSSVEVPEEKTYTVTFKQLGCEDVVVEVKEGEAVAAADMPAPQQKTGYTVAWEKVDLTNIKANIVVNAVETANEYTITYNANGGEMTTLTQKVTYDSNVTLLSATYEGYTFQGWKMSDGTVLVSGPWTIASDVTLTAEWLENIPDAETFVVRFNQQGQTKDITVNKGEAVPAEEIPALLPVEGYNVSWDATEYAKISNVTENLVINAVATAKTYTITIAANGKGTVETTTMNVTYNANYTMPMAMANAGYTFAKWTLNGTEIAAEGVWKYDMENMTVNAEWTANKYTVTLNANGGKVSQTSIEVTYGEAYSLPKPTRDGYVFEGWYQGDKKVELNGNWFCTGASIELKASWKEAEDSWTKNY